MDDPKLPFTERFSARQWAAADIVLAVLLAAAAAAQIAARRDLTPTGTAWLVVRYLCAGVVCGSLPLRRRWPMAVLGAVALALAFLLAVSGVQVASLAVLPAVYSVSSVSTSRTSMRAIVAALAVIEAGALSSRNLGHGTMVLATPVWAAIGWLAGENTRARRASMRGALERAAEREREREQRARRAAAEERIRIARELHDVVAHAMSVIAVRSGVARLVLDTRPDEAREALGIIEGTSRQALRELRLLVGVLRGYDTDGARADRDPAPGLADLPGLVGRISEAGVPVSVRIEGEPRRLGPGVDLSAYRIVQEALTNVVRHAAPASAGLTLRYCPSEVVIEVTDDGHTHPEAAPPPLAGAGTGHGIVGMRERAAVYGGHLVAEPTPSGFRVLARIPTGEAGS